jgi:hypothetical protein
MMIYTVLTFVAGALLMASAAAQRPETPGTSPASQPSDISTTISSGEVGTPPRFAVPNFIALSSDAETVDAAKVLGVNDFCRLATTISAGEGLAKECPPPGSTRLLSSAGRWP